MCHQSLFSNLMNMLKVPDFDDKVNEAGCTDHSGVRLYCGTCSDCCAVASTAVTSSTIAAARATSSSR